MIKYKPILLIGIICLGFCIAFSQVPLEDFTSNVTKNKSPETAETNYNIIESAMNEKLSQFATQGYFDQIYETSIQATYYALAALDILGKLPEISFSEMAGFIMSHYNTTSKLFMDEYTKRYLDTNYSIWDFPLNSLLLSNCYAVLSLHIIGYLHQINTSAMINFIWSCYNPETSGFIGRPYSLGLPSEWRVSTMDNTYYAVITYSLLVNGDWSSKATQKNAIIDFIESLQDMVRWGGFHNDLDPYWNSLGLSEPNIYSSYFCIKTLILFNWVPAIDLPAFHAYLAMLYHPSKYYFESMSYPLISNKTNIVSTALGLALCHLSNNVTFINTNEVLNFIITHRNVEGGFYRSSTYPAYELLDLYQILSGLEDIGEMTRLSVEDKQIVASFIITLYQQANGGFAPISKNYMSISLLYSIIGSFALFERETELSIQSLYSLISSYFNQFISTIGFSSCEPATTFRIQPIDYLSIGNHQFLSETRLPQSHYSTYVALMALKNLRKFNDFITTHQLEAFSDTVIQTQFLDTKFPQNFGAFNYYYNSFNPSQQNELISLRYSYYAIKILEFVANELGIGAINSLGFDVDALATHIIRHLITSSSEQYFYDETLTTPEEILEQTYFATYILNAINRNTLNFSKINGFIDHVINYCNIKNIYYCFKLSELLNLNFNFEVERVHALIQAIYSVEDAEFYLTPEKNTICQNALYYIADMAKNDNIRILASYPSEVPLGGNLPLNVTLSNLILRNFGPYTTVKLESNQLGTYLMDTQADFSFSKSLQIAAIASNFPSLKGEITVYEGSSKIISQQFEVFTTYDTIATVHSSPIPTKISFLINASVSFVSGTQAILNGYAFI
ncbi:MAG: prenyltransferase/squalene oxidase repeat-containing protein, partial [Candidatus Thorarchaeota archaeon]